MEDVFTPMENATEFDWYLGYSEKSQEDVLIEQSAWQEVSPTMQTLFTFI